MIIKSIVFINNKIRVFFSFFFFKLFRRTNLFFLPNLKYEDIYHKFNLSSDQVLIKTKLCALCGSDKKIVNFDFSIFSSALFDSKKHKKEKIYLGHEVLGEVIDRGKKVKKISIKDKIVLDSVIRNKKHQKSSNLFGGFSNYFVREQDSFHVISNKIKEEHALLIEPLACSYGAIKTTQIKKKDKILVVGAGVIGQGVIILLRYLYGKNIDITSATNSKNHLSILKKSLVNNIIYKKDIYTESIKILKTSSKGFLNNKILEKGYNKIFDCSGSKNLLNNFLRMAEVNGEIILDGMNMDYEKIDLTPVWMRKITIKGVNGYEKKYSDLQHSTFKFIHDLILYKKINVSNLKIQKISHVKWKSLFNNNYNGSIKKALYFN